MRRTSETGTAVGLRGELELMVVDSKTGEVVQHVKHTNHITEPFAWWLMCGNMGIPDFMGVVRGQPSQGQGQSTPDTLMTQYNSHNAITELFGSHISQPASYTGGQVVTCAARKSGNSANDQPQFGIYLLGERIDRVMKASTQIPPYLDSSLKDVSDRDVTYPDCLEALPSVPSYAPGSNVSSLVLDSSAKKWNVLMKNPAFTTAYHCLDSDNPFIVRSVVLGATHNGYADDPSYIMVRRSFPSIPASKDSTWTSMTQNQFAIPQFVPRYLLCPFTRPNAVIGTRDSDGIITSDPSAGTLQYAYFGLGGKEDKAGGANGTVYKVKELGGGLLNSNKDAIGYDIVGGVVVGIAGGMVVGTNSDEIRALRLDPAPEMRVNYNGTDVTRTIKIDYQSSLDGTSSVDSCTVEIKYPTSIPPSGDVINMLNECVPVIVPVRGSTAGDDCIEIFATMGLGEHTINSTLVTGFVIYKKTINLANFVQYGSGVYLDGTDEDVAVLPFAIGQCAVAVPSTTTIQGGGYGGTNGTVFSGEYTNRYCTGAKVGDKYYLPYTHICRGTYPCDWQVNSELDSSSIPVYLGKPVKVSNAPTGSTIDPKSDIQLGAVFAPDPDTGLAWESDFMFGIGGLRRTMLGTNEGLQPMIVNQTQRYAATWSSVISGVDLVEKDEYGNDLPLLDEGNNEIPGKLKGEVYKGVGQVLFVKYTYSFDINLEQPIE